MGWRQATSLVVARCGDGEHLGSIWPVASLRHGLLWITTWLELAGGLGRLSPGAVVCVEPPAWRDAPRYVAVLSLAGGLGFALAIYLALVAPVVVLPVAVATAVLMAQGLARLWRQRPKWRALRACSPPGAWRVVNLARIDGEDNKGAGLSLLDAVGAEADHHGRVLRLDTTSAALVAHYERSGFAVVGEVDFGTFEVVRMVRLPRR